MKQYIKDGKIIREGSPIVIKQEFDIPNPIVPEYDKEGNEIPQEQTFHKESIPMKIINPTAEQYALAGWEEYVAPKVESTPYVPTYAEKVEMFIREKYTISDELAILRQRDTKAEEFAEYYAFCEECKAKAKEVGV